MKHIHAKEVYSVAICGAVEPTFGSIETVDCLPCARAHYEDGIQIRKRLEECLEDKTDRPMKLILESVAKGMSNSLSLLEERIKELERDDALKA